MLNQMKHLAMTAGQHAPTSNHPTRYKLEYNKRMAFCGLHRHEQEYGDLSEREAYPRAGEVDWPAIWVRLEDAEVRRALARVCARPEKSRVFRQAYGDLQDMGRARWEEEYRDQRGMMVTHAG